MMRHVAVRLPPSIRPGDLVAVVSPASPSPRTELFSGLAWLRTRYELRMASGALTRHGYLAGDDERRARELAWALTAPGIGAIFAARGGYGVMRALELVDVRALAAAQPRWVVGFSDVTALHVELARAGVASVHSPNVTGLSSAAPHERLDLLEILERGAPGHAWTGLRTLVSGEAEGPVHGGNLTLLEAMAAAGRLEIPVGAILLLEDVTERPYRIDRVLTALRLGGHLSRAAAIVVGDFDRCEPGPDGVTVESVLAERLGDLGVPVCAGAPFGHAERNAPFVLGARARLAHGTLRFT